MAKKSQIGIDDLERHLEKQLGFLARSTDAFDQEFEDEAARMAQVVRILFHNTKSSHALLHQLGTQDTKILDTSMELVSGNLLGEMPLLQTGIGGSTGTKFYAPLSDSIFKRYIPGTNWWQQIVFKHQSTHEFSRRRLVLTLTNQDGGAHVDPALDDEYRDIVKDAFGIRFVRGESEMPRNDPAAETMRQIAHEVLISLKDGYSATRPNPSFGVLTGGASLQIGPVAKKFPPNASCPCKSGLKYKKCHGTQRLQR